MAAVVLAEGVSPEASVAEILGAGRCRLIPGSVALAEYQKECLANVHAFPALACCYLYFDFFRPLGAFTRSSSSRALACTFPVPRIAANAANWAARGRAAPCSHW